MSAVGTLSLDSKEGLYAVSLGREEFSVNNKSNIYLDHVSHMAWCCKNSAKYHIWLMLVWMICALVSTAALVVASHVTTSKSRDSVDSPSPATLMAYELRLRESHMP